MGILNRTPDSFFDGGQYWAFDEFLRKAEQLVIEGADFLDIGGSKAGPGPEVTVQEEMDRVVPAVEALRKRFDLPISVDTFRASVFEESCKVGANIGNDISGFADPDYLAVAGRHDASVVATHVRIGPRMPDPEPIYPEGAADVVRFLERRSDLALAAGIKRERIMIDAGLDLGKNPQMSAELLHHSDDLVGMDSRSSPANRVSSANWSAQRSMIDEATFGAHALGIALLAVPRRTSPRQPPPADTMSAARRRDNRYALPEVG